MSEIQPRVQIRRLTSISGEKGLFPGELVSVYVAGSAPALYQWDEAAGAWNQISDLGENADFAGTLDVSGAVNLDSTLDVAGAATFEDTFVVNAASTITGATSIVGQLTVSSGVITGTGASIRTLTTKQIITATQLRNLAASPVEIQSSSGAGWSYMFRGAALKYRGGSNVFDSVGAGDDLVFRYTNGSGVIMSQTLDTTDDIDFGSTTDANFRLGPLNKYVITENVSIVLDNVGTELASADDDANGDGTLEIEMEWNHLRIAA